MAASPDQKGGRALAEHVAMPLRPSLAVAHVIAHFVPLSTSVGLMAYAATNVLIVFQKLSSPVSRIESDYSFR